MLGSITALVLSLSPPVLAAAGGQALGLHMRGHGQTDPTSTAGEVTEKSTGSPGGSTEQTKPKDGSASTEREGEHKDGSTSAEHEGGPTLTDSEAEGGSTSTSSASGSTSSEGEGEGESEGKGASVPPEASPPSPTDEQQPESGANSAPAADPAAGVTQVVPPPSAIRDAPEHVAVAVGLAPRAPGTREEKALLDRLEASVLASRAPTVEVRRLRAGAGSPRRICRERRDDLVVMLDYVPDRTEPVVVAHDCRLDEALALRAVAAVDEPGLVAALWREHHALERAGARPRRRLSLSPRARGGIIAGVATVVVGVAVGALVANALRDEVVVIRVGP